MPVDSLVGRIGGLTLPLRPVDFDGTFTSVDPARTRLLALFSTAISYELAEVWANATANCAPLFNKQAVQDTLELEPNKRVMQERKADFPLLVLHRMGRAEYVEHTTEIDRRDQDWHLYYILPALKTEDLRRVGDVCIIVAEIVRRTIRNHGHRAFEDGALQWFGDASGIGSIRVKSQSVGQASFSDDENAPLYLMLMMELATSEYSQDVADEFDEFEGTDYHVGTEDDGGVLPEFIEAFDDVPLVDE